MAVCIRLKRFGRRNRPTWRIAVIDKRAARDGEPIEELGYYDKITHPRETKVSVNAERARYWLGVGAKPSRVVHQIFKRNGVYGGGAAAAGTK